MDKFDTVVDDSAREFGANTNSAATQEATNGVKQLGRGIIRSVMKKKKHRLSQAQRNQLNNAQAEFRQELIRA